jgi:hypothetical protein
MTWPANFEGSILFIRNELELGLTFALIAAHASNEEKFERNQRNARRACNTARRFMSLVEMSDDQAAEFSETLGELEHRLGLLGSFASQLA